MSVAPPVIVIVRYQYRQHPLSPRAAAAAKKKEDVRDERGRRNLRGDVIPARKRGSGEESGNHGEEDLLRRVNLVMMSAIGHLMPLVGGRNLRSLPGRAVRGRRNHIGK